MNYHMTYEREISKTEKKYTFRRFVFTTVFFLCFLWLVSTFWPDGRYLLKQLLIPGDPDITLEAAEVFAQEIGSGFSLQDAAKNFCDVVLNRGHEG